MTDWNRSVPCSECDGHSDPDYSALIAIGHSPLKAAQIALDAKRGDKFSQDWIKLAKVPNGAI